MKKLEGDWQNVKDSAKHEIWKVQGDTLKGKGLQNKNGKTQIWETLRIFTVDDQLVYEAGVIGNKELIAFIESNSKVNEILFTNLEHNFPNHIHYEFTNPNHLRVEVYDTLRSKVLKFEFKRKMTTE